MEEWSMHSHDKKSTARLQTNSKQCFRPGPVAWMRFEFAPNGLVLQHSSVAILRAGEQ